jgi:Family of unknown function (DUF6428)
MKLSEIKKLLSSIEALNFELQNGTAVPEHFHVTEVGVVTKHFIDCGGTIRNEKVVNFQLWNANDFEHRLKSTKLLNIITLSEEKLGMEDLEIEVEYQAEIEDSQSPIGKSKNHLQTIGKYNLEFNGKSFVLVSKHTACLAADACGISQEKLKVNLAEVTAQNSCKPGGGCC